MAKLHFKYSCMGGGKTLDLIRTAYNYEERGLSPLLLTSAIDNRYGQGKITTRVGLQREALIIDKTMNVYEFIKNYQYDNKIDVILIDEAMFLSKEHILQLTDIVDTLNIPVVCYGLRSTYTLDTFDGSTYLLSLADEITEIKAICHCGRKATINTMYDGDKIVKQGEKIVIGGNGKYTSLCRKCWKEGNLK